MNSPKPILLLAAASAVVLICGCRPQATTGANPELIATVGGTAITVAELLSEIENRKAKGLEPEPQKVLEELVQRETLVARARQLGLEQDPEVVRAYKNLLIAELKARQLEPGLQKIQRDCTSETTPNESTDSAGLHQVHLAVLRQTLPPKASAAKMRQVNAWLREARERALKLPAAEPGFGSLAIDYSDEQSTRYRGGDLGWMVEDAHKLRYDSAVLQAASVLKTPGEISPVVQGQDGWYLVRLVGRKTLEKGQLKPSEQRDGVAYHAQRRKRQELEQVFEKDARAKVEVIIYTNHLPALETIAETKAVQLPSL